MKRSKNMTQYFQLADRIAGRQRQLSGQDTQTKKPTKLLSFDSSQLMSPDKNSSFLLSQLVSSPSPAKATPKKLLTHTPSKLLESPSQNTRSKQGVSPAVNLFKSPTSRYRLNSPRCQQLQTSVSRRQSPQVLAPASDTKGEQGSPETTPSKKDTVCGLISAGLDSPSQNTRLRTSQTPTRKSVRAALFAKSPRSNRVQSPHRSNYSPRTLATKFGSPCKQTASLRETRDSFSDADRSITNTVPSSVSQTEVQNNGVSKRRTQTDIISKTDVHDLENNVLVANLADSSSSNQITDQKQGQVSVRSDKSLQKTPSPRGKKVTKTPDSFDKWHRRKPRSCLSSPSVNKTIRSLNPVREKAEMNNELILKNLDGELKTESVLKPVLGTARNKRRLIQSPEKLSIESPSKRVKIAKKGSYALAQSTRGESQGFDPAGSFSDLSQLSNVSSDYFSVANDDVFLSQSQNSDSGVNKELETIDLARKTRVVQKSSLSGSQGFSSSQKALERMLSSDMHVFDSSDNERSDSPIFSSSRVSSQARTSAMSGECKLRSHDSDGFSVGSAMEVETASSSPKFSRISPGTKKYSPHVSAKSLMHLIQSPLLHSPEARSAKESLMTSPGQGTKVAPAAARSRRSLKMHN